jgi:hypothetical protein
MLAVGMGTDYGHPLRLAYHVALILLAIAFGILVIAWGFRNLIPYGRYSLRGMMGGYGMVFGLTALCLLVWVIW